MTLHPEDDGTRGPEARSDRVFSSSSFPLPPLAEQRRIVAKVEELMALLDRLEAARTAREATRDRLTAASLTRLTAPDATSRLPGQRPLRPRHASRPHHPPRPDQTPPPDHPQPRRPRQTGGAGPDRRTGVGVVETDRAKRDNDGQYRKGNARKMKAIAATCRDDHLYAGPIPKTWARLRSAIATDHQGHGSCPSRRELNTSEERWAFRFVTGREPGFEDHET